MDNIIYRANGKTKILEREAQAAYNRSSRHWEVWQGDYDRALLVGGVTAYPAGIEGKRAALLSALTHDAPGVAAEVEAIMQNRPELTDRAIKAGQLVAGGAVELLHLDHYRVQSQSDPRTFYIVANFREPNGWRCQCADWHNGQATYIWGFERRSFAPFTPGIGITCKHVLACIIAETLTPHTECPACQGKAYNGFETVEDGFVQCRPCAECNGTGAVLANPHEDMAYYEEKIQDLGAPMSYEDLPLSDDEAAELEELQKAERDALRYWAVRNGLT